MPTLSFLVRKELAKQNKKQSDLAQFLGIADSYLSQLLAGKRGARISELYLRKMALFLAVEYTALKRAAKLEQKRVPAEEVRERIRAKMREKKLSQGKLTRLGGLAQGNISRILSGEGGEKITYRTLERIAHALETTPEWLYTGREEFAKLYVDPNAYPVRLVEALKGKTYTEDVVQFAFGTHNINRDEVSVELWRKLLDMAEKWANERDKIAYDLQRVEAKKALIQARLKAMREELQSQGISDDEIIEGVEITIKPPKSKP